MSAAATAFLRQAIRRQRHFAYLMSRVSTTHGRIKVCTRRFLSESARRKTRQTRRRRIRPWRMYDTDTKLKNRKA